MNCKHCQADLEEGTSVCPNCGELQTEQSGVKTSRMSVVLVILAAALLIVLVAVVVFTVNTYSESDVQTDASISENEGNGGSDITPENNVQTDASVPANVGNGGADITPQTTAPAESTAPTTPTASVSDFLVYADIADRDSYTVDAQALAAAADKVVASAGSFSLTNEQLQTFYWVQFNEFMNEYGFYAYYLYGLDSSQPLDAQKISGVDVTWEQYFLDGGISLWYQCALLNILAQEQGYTLDAETQTALDELIGEIEADALENGFASADDLVAEAVGPFCTAESYHNYMGMYWTAMCYSAEFFDALQLTDEEIRTYFDEHAAEFEASGITEGTAPFVDVRHILLMPTGGTADASGRVTYSDAEWEACFQEAQAILDAWTAGEATEDSFAQLANQHSKDGGSNTTGGLYENVTDDGTYVEAFTNWCVEDGRKTGDTGIVRTEYGYHIMYCVQVNEAWYVYAEEQMLGERYSQELERLEERFPLTYTREDIALGSIPVETSPEATTPAQ